MTLVVEALALDLELHSADLWTANSARLWQHDVRSMVPLVRQLPALDLARGLQRCAPLTLRRSHSTKA